MIDFFNGRVWQQYAQGLSISFENLLALRNEVAHRVYDGGWDLSMPGVFYRSAEKALLQQLNREVFSRQFTAGVLDPGMVIWAHHTGLLPIQEDYSI